MGFAPRLDLATPAALANPAARALWALGLKSDQPPNRVAPTVPIPVMKALRSMVCPRSDARREDALHRDVEIQGQVRLHVVVKLVATARRQRVRIHGGHRRDADE